MGLVDVDGTRPCLSRASGAKKVSALLAGRSGAPSGALRSAPTSALTGALTWRANFRAWRANFKVPWTPKLALVRGLLALVRGPFGVSARAFWR